MKDVIHYEWNAWRAYDFSAHKDSKNSKRRAVTNILRLSQCTSKRKKVKN
jgi:hypothetical protein